MGAILHAVKVASLASTAPHFPIAPEAYFAPVAVDLEDFPLVSGEGDAAFALAGGSLVPVSDQHVTPRFARRGKGGAPRLVPGRTLAGHARSERELFRRAPWPLCGEVPCQSRGAARATERLAACGVSVRSLVAPAGVEPASVLRRLARALPLSFEAIANTLMVSAGGSGVPQRSRCLGRVKGALPRGAIGRPERQRRRGPVLPSKRQERRYAARARCAPGVRCTWEGMRSDERRKVCLVVGVPAHAGVSITHYRADDQVFSCGAFSGGERAARSDVHVYAPKRLGLFEKEPARFGVDVRQCGKLDRVEGLHARCAPSRPRHRMDVRFRLSRQHGGVASSAAREERKISPMKKENPGDLWGPSGSGNEPQAGGTRRLLGPPFGQFGRRAAGVLTQNKSKSKSCCPTCPPSRVRMKINSHIKWLQRTSPASNRSACRAEARRSEHTPP